MTTAKHHFRELITPFLRQKLKELELRFGQCARVYQALARQYVRAPEEENVTTEANLRHYEADVALHPSAQSIPGVERLYRRTLVIEPTLACAAHCRYCIRANYPRHNLSEDQLLDVARYCGNKHNRLELNEVLITGGDVLLIPHRVDFLLRAIIQHAPNIRIARIATRIPVQAPDLINEDLLTVFRNKPGLRIELATQINHSVELFPEVVAAYERIMAEGVRVYAQNVLLRGVNDDLNSLVDLYDALRLLGIESHYLFHCVPLKGMAHLRIPLERAIELARLLSTSGLVSGRAKPMAAAMTDIGKIVLYEGVIVNRTDRHILLQSQYRFSDRRKWNPNWRLPGTAEVDRDGLLRVHYLDGTAVDDDQRSMFSDDSASNSSAFALPVASNCA